MPDQYPEMVLAGPTVSTSADAETETAGADEQFATAADSKDEPALDPRVIAERVYQLMCEEVRVECQRRGWKQ